MILEARDREALTEVLVIASALSVQDVRDRPLEQQQAADQAHKKFDDEKSRVHRRPEAVEVARGRHAAGRASTRLSATASRSSCLRDNFISPRRVREWRDIHSQLHTVVAEHGWRLNASAGDLRADPPRDAGRPARQHRAARATTTSGYLGARGIRFYRHPGAHLSKKPGRWIVAAELVETTRLFGRGIAAIEPQWLPSDRRRT